jgi:HSP20 family protein
MTSASKSSAANNPSQEIQRRSAAIPSPWDDIDRFFEGAFPGAPFRFGRWPWPEWTPRFESKLPAVDVIDRPDHILVRAEIPGVKKEDLDVSVSDDMVTIRATSKYEEEKKEEGEYYRREMRQGEYSRSIGLPANVDSAEARASFKDGILELTLPKTAPSKRRSVKVE